MKMMIENSHKFSKKYMRDMLLAAVRRVSANPVLLELLEKKAIFRTLIKRNCSR
jgi:hypothetical protein